MGQGKDAFIQVKDLSFKTPLGLVFENVSFAVPKGKICAIFGEQGQGKTSLMLTLSGRMRGFKGQARVAGHNLKKEYRAVRRQSAVSFIPTLNDVQPFLKIKDIAAAELSLVGKRGNKANTKAFLETWGFAEKKDIQFRNLSSYESTCFGIVLAMAGNPELLIVDDIQSNLTQYQSVKITKTIHEISAQYGTTVLFGSSEYEIARHADGIVLMGQGAVLQRAAVMDLEHIEVDIQVYGYGNDANSKKTASEHGKSNTKDRQQDYEKKSSAQDDVSKKDDAHVFKGQQSAAASEGKEVAKK